LLPPSFLPKTVHFNLPGTPPRGSASEKKQPRPVKLQRQPSLFQPNDITPPTTPTDEKKQAAGPFANEDGLPVHVPDTDSDTDTVRAPADRSSPTWGGRPDQPMSRANSPP